MKGRVFILVLVACATLTVSAAPQAPPAAPPQGRGRSPYQEAGQLPARIMEFKAEPVSIKPGESTTLTWAVENPRTTTIDPTIGRAMPRGVLKVTPKATTTYTLTVTGVNGTLTKTVTVNVAGTTAVAATTSLPLNQQPAPRTADGKPDLSGVYGYAAGPGRGAPPPPAVSGDLPRTPTLKPGAEKYRVVRAADDTGQ